MPGAPDCSELRLVNGSIGDPGLFIDYTGKDDALLFDAGENASLDPQRLGDLEAVFITHHHVDHFIGLDRIVRANLDRDKALHIYGPVGTITKVYDRIKSYEYPFFPFQKIVLKVHEILEDSIRSAFLECSRRFPTPEVHESPRDGLRIYENQAHLSVEAVHVDHTVPCLAYALVEPTSITLDSERLAHSSIKPGSWIQRVSASLDAGAPPDAKITVDGRTYALATLRERFFNKAPGRRIAYVTDTAWNEKSRPGLLRLAQQARRLYCDSFYAKAQGSLAVKHHHMTCTQAAEFATQAEVVELVLIHFATRYHGRYQELLDAAKTIFPNTTAEF